MRVRFFLIACAALFLASCSSSRRVTTTKKKKTVTVVEPKPEKKLPSVRQLQHVKKLERNKPGLNRYTLQYIRKYAPLAVMEMHEYKIPASITLAQGILESGNGRSELASKSNNHFGIKCHRGWNGKRVYHDDDEKGECFRKYKYVQTSYEDHSKFLTSRQRYAGLFKLRKNDYKGWAKGLKKAGYATDKKYPKKLIKIIEDYRLYEFDKFTKKDLRRGKREKVKEKKEEKEAVVNTNPKYSIPNYYTVKKGDTLYSIAKRFNTTVKMLKEINGLKDNTLSIGQKLLTK
jgi:flagellum-specific peptidoglycan hydrolase FlgJ